MGVYKDISSLENLKKLKYLYIGGGAGIENISMLGELKTLIVLYIENFKKVDNYTPLTTLNKLEQLIISGPILGYSHIKDYEFLRELKNLKSVWFPNTTTRRKYTKDELTRLHNDLQNLTFIYNSSF